MTDDQEEPTLPALSAISRRKRARIDDGGGAAAAQSHTSSDPAFFSSDDDPSVDNYAAHRKKKRYVGSWYQQHPAAASSSSEMVAALPGAAGPHGGGAKRRPFERQFDSGVWLGSDATDDSILEELELPAQSRLPLAPARPAQAARGAPTSEAERAAQARIRECIETGDENIDLSSMGLETLSNPTVGALSEFACIPTVEKGVPFVQRDPSLKLYLSGNGLRRVPGALFDLEHLTVLSLRNNGLRELPPAVAKLRNLRSLNVSLNALRCLPAELLELVAATDRLAILQLHPNPFYQPERGALAPEAPEDGRREGPARDAWLRFTGRYRGELLARTPVEFSDTAGRVYSDFRIRPEAEALPTEAPGAGPAVPSSAPYLSKSAPAASAALLPPQQDRHTRVPTLLELALRACYRAPQRPQGPPLAAYLPDHAPPHAFELLDRVAAQRATGGLACSVCGRFVVKPRAEWVEWWDVRQPAAGGFEPLSSNGEERAVPFVRRGCSWRCIPRGPGAGAQ